MGREVKEIIMENKNIIKALIEFQSKISSVNKSSQVKMKLKAGGEFSFKYADYDSVIEATRSTLLECKLVIYHLMIKSDHKNETTVRTILAHESGEELESVLTITHDGTPQKIGSSLTYAKRYQYLAILCLATDDDDAQTSQKAIENQKEAIEQKAFELKKKKEKLEKLDPLIKQAMQDADKAKTTNQAYEYCENMEWSNRKIVEDLKIEVEV